MVWDAGYQLRTIPNGIGSLVGTGAHKTAEAAIASVTSCRAVNRSAAVEAGIAEMRIEASKSDGIVFDATTDSINTGEKQIQILGNAFCSFAEAPGSVVKKIARCETTRTAEVFPGMRLSGRVDCETVDDNGIDWKFGIDRQHFGQVGGYSLLRKAYQLPTGYWQVVSFPRPKIGKPFAGHHTTTYDIETAETVAYSILQRVYETVKKFRESGDCWDVAANPSSTLCGEKYCPAWGTNFCCLGR